MFKELLIRSAGARLAIIAFLTLILLIPATMIRFLITERQERREDAILEVNQKWGGEQYITGPVLTVPYKITMKNEKNAEVETIQYAHFLPDNLTIDGRIEPERRHRGIYEIVLYDSHIALEGHFGRPVINVSGIQIREILWQDAFVSVGITDMKGIEQLISCTWNDQQIQAEPGITCMDLMTSGITVPITLKPGEGPYHFDFTLDLKGSSGLYFTPVGKETDVHMASQWKDPSFLGTFLPESYTITDKGFDAKWNILHMNRNYPQSWTGDRYRLIESAFGVNLLLPVDEYQKTMRTVKYAIMFIGLTFLSLFIIELLSRKLLHPIQYLFIGFALLIFYTLLLSLSEHVRFNAAYLLSTVSIILMISGYTRSVLKNTLQMLIVSAILTLLYGYLFIILTLQDYALLMGSLGLFAVLGSIMFLTRKIDWFTMKQAESGVS